MILVFFFLSFRKKKLKYNVLDRGSYYLDINKLQTVSNFSDRNSKSTNNHCKYYIIYINNEKHFFKTELFQKFKNIFTPDNCIFPQHFRSYLNQADILQLQKSQYLTILDIPKQLKFINSKHNSKISNANINAKTNSQIVQYLVQASSEFPKYFGGYGIIRKMLDEIYSFTIIQNISSQSFFKNYIKTVTEKLINSNLVFLFELSPSINLLNRFSIGYTQTGLLEMKTYTNKIRSYNPLHELHLTGAGEVITISDSGLTPGATWFVDPKQSSYPYNKYEQSQRKIVYYSTYTNRGTTDQTDYTGHGTHVAGSALGNSESPNEIYSLFDGAAPDAKAIIVDLEDGYGNMRVDIELQQTLNRMKDYDSFINTNSWGLEEESMTVNYLYNNAATKYPEFLFIFAAGNDGRFQSINSPGSLKNVLTVGALDELKSTSLNLTTNIPNKNIIFNVFLNNINQNPFTANSLNPNDNNEISNGSFRFKSIIMEMNNKECLETIYNVSVLLYNQSIKDFKDKAIIVSNCNEVSDSLLKNAKVIIVKSVNDISSIQCIDYQLQAKAFGLELPWSYSQFQSLPGNTITVTPQVTASLYLNDQPTVASFSSRGPNSLGAIKPEIVAPGTNITSASHTSSLNAPHLSVMSGTSMATPLVAGSMSVLHQYLKEKRGLTNEQIHSHLMKAIAIASADKPNPKIPDFEYGFGRLNLANVIPEITSVEADYKLKMEFLTDLKMKSESTYIYSFEVTSKNIFDVRVAFSYLDASSQLSDTLNIKANLNVQTPDKVLLFPLGEELEDSFSTVERIFIPKDELITGIYTIIISTSEYVFNEIINGSIVVSGPIRNLIQVNGLEASSSVQRVFDWNDYCVTDNTVSSNSNGDNLNGDHLYNECQCNQYSSGLLCQHKSKEISFGAQETVRMSPFETYYYYSVLNADSYSNILFNWEQISSQSNYIMLRLNIAKSAKRLSQYQYFFASNKTTVNIGGPTKSDGSAIEYEQGTQFFFAYTNFGPTTVTLSVSCSIEKKGNSFDKTASVGVSLSVSMYLILLVVIIVIIIVIVLTCRKRRRRNAQIDGATSSSVSSSSSSNTNNNGTIRRHRHSNQQQIRPEQQLYNSNTAHAYGNQMDINPYYNVDGYDPNLFPAPSNGSVTYYQPSYDGYYQAGDDSDNEAAPQYSPPTSNSPNYYYNNVNSNGKNNDSNTPIPINPYANNFYQTQRYDEYCRHMYDY